MIVLGVDPGTRKTGYAVLSRTTGRFRVLDSGVIKLNEKLQVEERLPRLFDEINRIIVTNGPTAAAVESLFFSKNASSALKLGHARGVIMLALQRHELQVASYAPAMVKKSVVGGGRAAKGQIQKVVQAILGLKVLPAQDEADAMAIAICHLNAPATPCAPPRTIRR